MPATSVQFTVAAHIMAALGFFRGKELSSATLAESVNADPTFVRKSLSKLSNPSCKTFKPNWQISRTRKSCVAGCSTKRWMVCSDSTKNSARRNAPTATPRLPY